ncbi:PIG-L deacetylase family protein [Thermofilum pendens]|uniref:LmbE family protein n=1 Tax=Thermofilum pendens (strain DSM 2475 / Hrk 5) TaxID=368408 RepID=A1RZG3_THEPD|nr:PIG-L deacetylase family protein [Thermofilum pendens]ABL78593.1 LmbE family protein [Thermofilum pendens Hrk 5]
MNEGSLEDYARKLASELGPEEALRRVAAELFEELKNPFEDAERVLCVGPHPDDCEYGAGGTLAYLARSGKRVVYLILTDGSKGTTSPGVDPRELAEIRRKEQEEAARIIGVEKVIWLGYPDTELPYTPEARNSVIRVIREERPDVVFSPDPWLLYEAHPDHRVGGLLAAEAVMLSPLPLVHVGAPHAVKRLVFYYTARPNFFQPVDGYVDIKLNALRSHRSQFEENWGLFELYLKTLMAAYGARVGARYAEPLRVLPATLLHATALSEIV